MTSPATRTLVPAAFVLLAMAAAAPASGQAPQDSLRSVVRRAQEAGWHVRVTTPEHMHDGRVTRVRPDTLMLVGARVAMADVTAVERRVPEGGGQTIGALLGALAFGAFGLAAASMCEGTDCTSTAVLTIGGGAMIGGLFGALVGNVVAPPRERWDPLWPTPPATPN